MCRVTRYSLFKFGLLEEDLAAALVAVYGGLGSLRCTGRPCTPEGAGEVAEGLRRGACLEGSQGREAWSFVLVKEIGEGEHFVNLCSITSVSLKVLL